MRRRYIRAYRTRSNTRETNALREQFLRELTQEANLILQQALLDYQVRLGRTPDFNPNARLVQGDVLLPDFGGRSTGTPTITNPIQGFGQLLSTGVRYLFSRPRTSRRQEETARSVDVLADFKLGQAQAAAELQALMARGEKNV